MKKAILSFVVVAFASKVCSQQQPQLPVIQFDMNDFMAHQQAMQAQHERNHQQMHHVMPPMHQMPPSMQQHGREDHEMEEPVVGSPLMGLGAFGITPLGLRLGMPHLGLGHGLPGLRYSNLNAGHLGRMHFANSVLGAGNPMEAEQDAQLAIGHHHGHHHFINSELGSPQNFQMDQQLAAAPVSNFQAEPQLAAPQHTEGFFPFHFANLDDSQLGAVAPVMFPERDHQTIEGPPPMAFPPLPFQNQPEQFQVALPPFDGQPMGPPQPMMQPFPAGPIAQMEEDARTWGKFGHKKDYGYG